MGLLDGIERLINEHGSAAILKERIVLANDKYAMLEAKVYVLEKKIIDLETEKTTLQTENQNLKFDNEQLTIKVQNLEKIPTGRVNLLEEVKANILVCLSKNPFVTEAQIAQTLNIGPPVAKFHLEELKTTNMVKRAIAGSAMKPVSGWSLAQEGTRYLIDQRLIA